MFKKAFYFESRAIPPYNFELTVHKPAGWWLSNPSEIFENGILWTTVRLYSHLYGLKLEGFGSKNNPQLACNVFSAKPIENEEESNLIQTVQRATGVKEDLTDFYALASSDEILQKVVQDLQGMHTVFWPELFPALILATTLQMAPMKRSNQMMHLLIENYGDKVSFDGKIISHWPSPKRIAMLSVNDLMNQAKLGYRAKNLLAIAKSLRSGFPDANSLSQMEPDEVKKKLLTLRGIGEYSAEIIMPSMGFPADVWSAKIFNILFFGTEPDSPREEIPKIKKEAEARWGKWRGHAFVYVLNDLPNISKRIGIDLTRF